MKSILKILVPKLWCAESGYLGLVAASLIVRSICDIWMISNGTFIERYQYIFYFISE